MKIKAIRTSRYLFLRNKPPLQEIDNRCFELEFGPNQNYVLLTDVSTQHKYIVPLSNIDFIEMEREETKPEETKETKKAKK